VEQNRDDSWFTVGGESDPFIAETAKSEVKKKIALGLFKEENVRYLAQHRLALLDRELLMNDSELEKLRILAKNFMLTPSLPNFTSHRRFIGPVIVFFKKLLFPIFAAFTKETFQRQSDFNANLIELLVEMSSKRKTKID
jgi:hypothetical protein